MPHGGPKIHRATETRFTERLTDSVAGLRNVHNGSTNNSLRAQSKPPQAACGVSLLHPELKSPIHSMEPIPEVPAAHWPQARYSTQDLWLSKRGHIQFASLIK